jgi:hypothetical protein
LEPEAKTVEVSNLELKSSSKERDTMQCALPLFTPAAVQELLWEKYRRSTAISALRRALDWNDAWGYDDVLLRQLQYAEAIAPPVSHPVINRARRRGSPYADDIARNYRKMMHNKHVAQGHALVERLLREFLFPAWINPYDELAHAMGHVVLEAIRVGDPGVHMQLAAVGALLGGSELSHPLI